MAEPFLGEIRMTGFNFAPLGWALCDGQLLPINQNTALFSLLGTQFGGNGQTNFALPDLRGRVPVHQGQGNGLSPRSMGEQGGAEAVTLAQNQMPAHTHTIAASSNAATSRDAVGNFPAKEAAGQTEVYATSSDSTMSGAMVGVAGGSQPHDNLQPFLTVNFIIALQGIYPARF